MRSPRFRKMGMHGIQKWLLNDYETLTVFNDLSNSVPVHPIKVGERNICQLARANKLHALKVSELREICEELGLRGQGSEKRKKTYIGPLQTYVERCSCT